MTQQEVYNLLRKKRRWMSTKEVRKIFKTKRVVQNLRKLFLHNEVERKEYGNSYMYRIKPIKRKNS